MISKRRKAAIEGRVRYGESLFMRRPDLLRRLARRIYRSKLKGLSDETKLRRISSRTFSPHKTRPYRWSQENE